MERELTEALSRWRVSRCEQLALNIDALHEHLVRTRPQFGDGRWEELCLRRREADLPGLLAMLPPVDDPRFGARLDSLRAFAPDPHLSVALRWALEAREDLAGPEHRALWRRVFSTLAGLGDPRVKGWLPDLVANQRGSTAASRLWLVREALALCGSLPAPARSSPPLVLPTVPLLSERSDVERLVTADWLSGFEDPLGEFLVLQHLEATRGLQQGQRKRMNQLQTRYARRWLGPLSRALKLEGLRFERGAVVAGTLGGVRALELAGHAGWTSVRALDLRALRSVNAARVAAFLRQPVLRSLTTLTGVPEPIALELAHEPLPFKLERLQIIEAHWHLDSLIKVLQTGRALGSLTALEHHGMRWGRSPEGEWRKA